MSDGSFRESKKRKRGRDRFKKVARQPSVMLEPAGSVGDLSGPDKEYLTLVQNEDERKSIHDYYGNDPEVTQFDYFLMDTRNGEPDDELYGLTGVGLGSSAYRIKRIQK